MANEELQATKIRIFPNPTSASLTLEGGTPGDLYELYDLHGKQVKRAIINTSSAIVQLDDLPTGVYTYRLSSDGNLLKTGKVVKAE